MEERTKQHMRGILLLIPLICFTCAVIWLGRQPAAPTTPTTTPEDSTAGSTTSPTEKAVALQPFDPNEADYRTLVTAGVPREVAVSILRWRAAGKVYRIKEDVALCYAMTDSLYFILEPYIRIGEQYRIKPRTAERTHSDRYTTSQRQQPTIEPTLFSLDTVTEGYLQLIGFSPRRAALVVRYRDMIGGYRTIDEFRECYAVGDSTAEALAPYLHFDTTRSRSTTLHFERKERPTLPINLNRADSATLRAVYGIGPKSIYPIMRYRELLGGYYSAEQLLELEVITEENFEYILQQIFVDSAEIKKININFASPKVLERHPYVSFRALRRIVKHRESKGGWSTVEELVEDKIFSEEEARRIAPYLDFGTDSE